MGDQQIIEILRLAKYHQLEKLQWYKDGKEEQADTRNKNTFSEDVRKFLIEHELGRRIAHMFLRYLNTWKENGEKGSLEPLARFLKSYSVFITDHTGKEDRFFDQ
jgi:hemerythrin-like domain-containing protein